jgi:hypothetical protein
MIDQFNNLNKGRDFFTVTGIQRPEVAETGIHDVAVPVGGPFQLIVVDDDKFVLYSVDVEFDPGALHLNCHLKRFQSVLGCVTGGTSMPNTEESHSGNSR